MSGGAEMLLQMVVKATDQASSVLRGIGQNAKEAMGGVKEVLGGAGLAADAVIGLSIKAAADYQTMTNNVRNNTTMSDADFQAMNQTIQQLGSETPTSLAKLAEGYMHVTNFGFGAADAQKILAAANMSAVSTGGDAADTANVLAAAMHEFSIPAGDAANAMDVMHLAAAQGNMTLEQLTESGGQAFAMAANMGVSLTDVSAAMSAMTRHGFDAATAATQVKDMISHIANPAAATRKELEALSKATGIDLVGDFSEAGLKAKGLNGVLADVQAATKGDSSEILKLIPNMRGGLGAMTLAGTGAKDYADILGSLNDAMAGKVTPSADAFARSQQTAAFQVGVMKNQLQEMLIAIGTAFLPVLEKLLQAVTPLVTKFLDWTKAHAGLVAQILTVVAVVGTFAGGLGMLGAAAGAAGLVLGPLAAIIGAVGLPLLAVTVAVVALAMAWSNNWGDIQGKTKAAWAAIQPVLAELLAFGQRVWDGFRQAVQRAWAVIEPDLAAAGAALQAFATQVLPQIEQIAGEVFGFLGDALAGFHDTWNTMWAGISTILEGAWQAMKGIIQMAWALISGIIKVALDLLTGNWRQAWTDMQATLKGMWDGYVNFISGAGKMVLGAIQAIIDAVLSVVHDFAPQFAQTGEDLIEGLKNGILAKAKEVADAAGRVVQDAINAAKNALGIHSPSKVFQEIGQFTGQGFVDGINAMAGQAKAALATMVNPDGVAGTAGAAGYAGGVGAGSALAGSGGGGPTIYLTITGNTFTNIAGARDIPRQIAQELATAVSQQLGGRLRGQGLAAQSTTTPR